MSFCSQGGSLSSGDSIHRHLCPRGSLSRGTLFRGSLCQEDPPPYGNERAVRILLECILVSFLILILICQITTGKLCQLLLVVILPFHQFDKFEFTSKRKNSIAFLFYLDGNSQFLNTQHLTVEIDYSHLMGIDIYSVCSFQFIGTPLTSYSIY